MSFIASMVAASAASAGLVTAGGIGAAALGAAATGAAGAGIGAGISAATGGDIGEGALMGGIGGLGAGAGAALGGATMGAGAIGAEGAAATPFAAAAPVAGAVAPTATTAGAVAPTASTTVAPTTVANTTPVLASNAPSTVTGATNAANVSVGGGAGGGAGGVLPPQPGSPDFIGATATPDQIANASAYTDANMGTRFLADLTNNQGNIVGNTGLKMAGGALQSGVMNAGISGLVAGAQGQDVGEAMGMGAATGAVGGAAGAGLASMAGSGGTLGSIGNFAAKHDVLVPAALSMGSNMALSRMIPDSSDNGMPESSPLKSKYRWNPDSYNAYLPRGNSFGSFAAGGITDLDNYDQTPQMQNPGTLDIPNRNEVANNQGYMGDSVQMMADGGIAKESYMLEGVGGKNLHREASKDLQEYLKYTPDTELTPEQRKQKAILFGNGMAHGGISDLGSYSDGGRLLKGPGDGVSDSINATIGGKQPARLATGEFVLPARIVSELGNGSTDAGAKRLYQMMDRIQSDRKKTTGKGKFSDNPKAYKHLPA